MKSAGGRGPAPSSSKMVIAKTASAALGIVDQAVPFQRRSPKSPPAYSVLPEPSLKTCSARTVEGKLGPRGDQAEPVQYAKFANEPALNDPPTKSFSDAGPGPSMSYQPRVWRLPSCWPQGTSPIGTNPPADQRKTDPELPP